jgi:hypothetical protein
VRCLFFLPSLPQSFAAPGAGALVDDSHCAKGSIWGKKLQAPVPGSN